MKSRCLLGAAFLVGIFVAFVPFCNHKQANNPPAPYVNPSDLVPADNEVPGWIIGESPNCFGQGVANDSDDLFRIIDGPGVLFAHNGFVNGAFQSYIDTSSISTGDTVALCLQVFNQSTHTNAVVIYRENGNDYTPFIPVTTLGEMARMDTAMTNIILETVYKNYYIRLIVFKRGPSTDEKYEQALLDFGAAIIKRINAALAP